MPPERPPRYGTAFQRYLHRNYRVYSTVTRGFRQRLTAGGWLVLVGLVLCAALGLDTSLSVAYQTFALLGAMAVVAVGTSRFSRVRLMARRSLPRFGSVGTPLRYRVTIENPSRHWRRSLTLIENLPDPRPDLREFVEAREPGEEKRNWFDRTYVYYRWSWLIAQNQRGQIAPQPIPALPPQGRTRVEFELLPLRRGVLQLEALTVACPDVFGLVQSLVRLPLPQKLLILPKRYQLPPVALPGTMQYQPGGVALASSVGESEEFVSLRDYRPGDPLRRIHWKSLAKTGRLIVKEYQDEFFVRHALVLDTFSPTVHNDLFEEAVAVAASFACELQTQDSLLDLLFVGTKAFCFTAGRGLAHTDQMLEILAAVTVCRAQPFRALRQLVLEHLPLVTGCVCVFLAWDDERQQLVERLTQSGVPLLVLVVVEPGRAKELDPGPLRGQPDRFRVLERDQVAAGLAAL